MRETNNVEFKLKFTNTFLKTVSAFANYCDGRVFFGVDDDGNAIGIENPTEVCLKIENSINDSIDPIPDFSLTIDQKTNVIELNVKEGSNKPFLCKGVAYRRADTSTRPTSREEFSRLVMAGQNVSFDEIPIKQNNLTFETLFAKLKERLGMDVASQSAKNNALISMELMSSSGVFNNAAALLCDSNKFRGIDIVRFGNSINIIKSRFTFENQSIISQIDDAMNVFDEHYTVEVIQGATREIQPTIPREAFREGIANALVHRCWSVNSSVRVGMFEDRIEIDSPGPLPEGITEEAYIKGGPSVIRNPIITNVFFRLGFIERFGTGILRIKQLYETVEETPLFIPKTSSVTVVLPVIGSSSFSEDEKRILGAFKGTTKTREEISKQANFSKDKTIRLLNSLIDCGAVRKLGTGRSSKYEAA